MTENRMTTIDKIERVLGTRQLLYSLLAIAIVVPLLNPVGLPIGISSRTRAIYTYIDKNLTPGSPVLIDLSYEMASRGELEPEVIALAKQLFQDGHKLVFMGTSAWAPVVYSLIQSMAPDVFTQKEYGKDYVFLGYVAGGESAVISMAKSMSKTIAVDNYGTPLSNLPLMSTADNATDYGLVFVVSSGTDTFAYYVRQWYTLYGTKLLFGALSVIAPSIEPYVGAGQAVGMMSGQRAAAEYELLVGRKGLANASMDAQSFAHGLILAFIIMGNIIYFVSARSKRGEKK
jgi:hypothetical protein